MPRCDLLARPLLCARCARPLTLSANPGILGGDASAVLTIDADNGLPMRDEVFPAKDFSPCRTWR